MPKGSEVFLYLNGVYVDSNQLNVALQCEHRPWPSAHGILEKGDRWAEAMMKRPGAILKLGSRLTANFPSELLKGSCAALEFYQKRATNSNLDPLMIRVKRIQEEAQMVHRIALKFPFLGIKKEKLHPFLRIYQGVFPFS